MAEVVEIEIAFVIEGLGVRKYLAGQVKYANNIKPRVMTSSAENGLRGKVGTRQDVWYYVNSEGSFACKHFIVHGEHHCDLVALIHDDKESCFIKGGEAFCQKNQ